MLTGYEIEIEEMMAELMSTFNFAKSINPNYTKENFVIVLKNELKNIDIKINAITRSGQHPTDELRVARFSHSKLIDILS